MASGLMVWVRCGPHWWSRLVALIAGGLGLSAGVGVWFGSVAANPASSAALAPTAYVAVFLGFSALGLIGLTVPAAGRAGRTAAFLSVWCILYFVTEGVLAGLVAWLDAPPGGTEVFPPAAVGACFAVFGLGLLAAGRFDRWTRRLMCPLRRPVIVGLAARRFERMAGWVLAASVIGVAGCGVAIGRLRMMELQAQVAAELPRAAVAKVAQVAAWRAERLLDARMVSRTPYLARAVAALAEHPDDARTRTELQVWMQEWLAAYGCAGMTILDSGLRPLVVVGAGYSGEAPSLQMKLGLALAERRVVEMDFGSIESGRWLIQFVVPLLRNDGSPPAGIALLSIDPVRELLPLVQGRTGLRRGFEVELLAAADVPPTAGAASSGATSLARFEALASQPRSGLIEATDARGAAVLGAARVVPDTSWVIAVKVDRPKMLAPLVFEIWAVGSGLTAVVVLVVWISGSLRRRRVFHQLRRDVLHARQMRDLRSRLALFLSHVNDAIFVLDRDLQIVDVNDRAAVLYGYEKARLLTMSVLALSSPDAELTEAAENIRAVGAAGLLFEAIHRRRDGTAFPVEVSIRRVELEGRPHFLGLIRDVTERRRAESELREARAEAVRQAAELTAIMQAVPAAVFVGHDSECREISGNQVAQEFMGLPDGANFSSPAAVEGIVPVYRFSRGGRELSVEELPLQQAARGNPVRGCELDIRLADGSVRTLLGNAVPLRDPAGQPRGSVGAFVDVTDWRVARDRQQVLFEHSPTAMWEEDFSAVQEYFGQLRRAGTTDFRRHLDANPSAVAKLAGMVKVVRSNRAGLQIFGVEDEKALAAGLPSFFNADSLAVFKEELIALEAGAHRFDCEVPVIDLQGRLRLLQLRLGVPGAFHDSLACVLISFVDLTELRKSESALHDRERIFTSIVEQASEGIVLVDAASGRAVEFNEAAHRTLGYSRDEFASRGVAEFLEGGSVELVRRKTEEVIKAGAISMDGRLRHRSGELLDVHLSARHLLLNGRDYVAAIWSDTTANKRAERELRAARLEAEHAAAELSAMMDAVPAAIFIAHDAECRQITGNSVTRSMLRLPPEANISKSAPAGAKPVNFRTFQYGRELSADQLPLQQAARGVTVSENELDLVFDDGTVRTTLGEARTLFDAEGRPRGAVGVFLDITERKRMEQSVREGRDLLAETQKIARIGSWEIEYRTDQLSWSDEIFNLVEFAPPAGDPGLLLKPLSSTQRDRFRALIHPEDRALLEEAFEESVRRRTPFSHVHRLLFADGRVKHVSESARTYYGADGAPLRSLGTVIDVTGRFEAEEALRRNERVLSSIFEGALVGICYADAQQGIQKVNARFCAMLGYSALELHLLDYRAYTAPDDIVAEDEMVRAIRDGRSEGFAREKRFIRKGGGSFWGNLSLAASRDRVGRLLGFVVVIEDITERREARETLRKFNVELEQRVAARSREIQGLLDSIPDTVLICSAEGVTLSCHTPRSTACPLVLGVCAESNGPGCTNPILQGLVSETCARVRSAGEAVIHEFDHEVQGETVSLEARAAPVGPDRVLILLRDISERKRLEREVRANLERERQLSEMKSQFVSVASHEFRTPLAAAVTTAQLLERYGETIAPDKRASLLNRLDRSLRRLTEIINDVLIVSRVDANRFAVHLVPTDLPQVVREVISEIGESDRHRHEFSFQSSGPAAIIQVDVKLLHHILSNVIGNAAKYSPEGTTVRVALDIGVNDFTLTVADEGIGVPRGEEERIFEPFGRASNVGEIGGTGLGLDIVRRFTELMGGRIDLIPASRGATFRIIIPLTPSEVNHGAV